jgi:hypothetical protein
MENPEEEHKRIQLFDSSADQFFLQDKLGLALESELEIEDR